MKKFKVTQTQSHSAVIEAVDSEQAIMSYGDEYDGFSVEMDTVTTAKELPDLNPNTILEELDNGIHYMCEAFDYLGMAIAEEVGETGIWENSELDYPRCELQDLMQRIQKLRKNYK